MKTTRALTLKFIPMLLAIAAISACSDPTSLSKDGPAGKYVAITLVTTSNATPSNELAAGGTFTIDLARNGTTSGHLHLVATAGHPALDADMSGTWVRTGDTIDFTQAADTFVRDMTFTIEQISDTAWFLVGDQTFAGTRINVRLAQDNS